MQHKPRKLHVNIQYLATKTQLFFFLIILKLFYYRIETNKDCGKGVDIRRPNLRVIHCLLLQKKMNHVSADE